MDIKIIIEKNLMKRIVYRSASKKLSRIEQQAQHTLHTWEGWKIQKDSLSFCLLIISFKPSVILLLS
jgi:hypothetical protein